VFVAGFEPSSWFSGPFLTEFLWGPAISHKMPCVGAGRRVHVELLRARALLLFPLAVAVFLLQAGGYRL
jgi:hypothetical protein